MYIPVRKNGIAVRIVDLAELFEKTPDKLIVNSFDLTRADEKERLNKLLYTHYEGDTLSAIPACECGHTTGQSNVGMTCMECGTVVLAVTERPLISVAWVKPPEGVSMFINPRVWTILSAALTVGGVNLLEWICNPTSILMPEQVDNNRFLKRATTLGINHGINYFYENFDLVMAKLFDAGLVYSSGNRRQRQDLAQFLSEYRKCIFTPALPIPSKLTFITEKTVTRTYSDKTIYSAMDAILTITATENSPTPLSMRVKQSRTVKANSLLAKYYQDFIGNTLARKPGLMRKHVMGARLHFTFRAVISSLSNHHHRSELHLPWALAVKVFDMHLTAKLFRLGYSVNEAATYLADHVLQHSDLLEELFKEIIDEAKLANLARPEGSPEVLGFPVLLNRNPTLMRGSIQRMFVTMIIPDPHETSIRMSVLALKAPNQLHTF